MPINEILNSDLWRSTHGEPISCLSDTANVPVLPLVTKVSWRQRTFQQRVLAKSALLDRYLLVDESKVDSLTLSHEARYDVQSDRQYVEQSHENE